METKTCTSRLSPEQSEIVASRLQQHRSDVLRHLPVNLTSLLVAGIEIGLVQMKELDFYHNQKNSREEKIHKLLASVEQKPDGCSMFLQCIRKLTNHLGHVYLEALLEGNYYAEIGEIEESAILQSRIEDNMSQFMDINLKELGPILFSKHLITEDEFKTLSDMNTQLTEMERNLRLFEILYTKGPTAHTLFARCLEEEHSHLRHKELHEFLYSSSENTENVIHGKKRKRDAIFAVVLPEKRSPKCIEMHGSLKTAKYAEMVRSWRHWVSNGQWNETERAEHECMQQLHAHDHKKPLAVTLAGLLQSAIARIVRKHYTEAEKLLEKCDHHCSKVKGDNHTFLHGRCKYTWSWLHRYLKRTDLANACARDAMQILFNVEPGEDKALANYGFATTIIDCQSNANCPNQVEVQSAESSLEFAIYHATIEDRGLDHIAPHSQLRLAQMYLGSTHYDPGKNTDPESIRKASDCLKAIDRGSLPPRSKCMLLLTESDYYRCKGDITMARESANQAQMMAEANSFETEVTSAKTKLESLQ